MATAGSSAGRTAAILTNAEVFGSDCDLSSALDGRVTVDFSLTIGSLTSCTVKAYAGPAATPTDLLYQSGLQQVYSFTGSVEAALVFNVPGCRYFRISVEGIGTATNSTCNFTYRFQDYQATTMADGGQRID